jgi:sRNA-binding carbon storage regulator CsrA
MYTVGIDPASRPVSSLATPTCEIDGKQVHLGIEALRDRKVLREERIRSIPRCCFEAQRAY